ncbi:hypothetical protein FKW77_005215 [Venturia effusa]|uniref:Pleckstrin homology domain-containing protein n=1 Tax=Venturia effusa TaxID=50376 RepID=A0A517LR90_9PEZI|nr:hypothetical protein FKW77_005215 [Venturia effusa]
MVTKDYFSDLEGLGSGPSLPSPLDTTYQTPRMSNSRRSSRHASHSRNGSSSPPLMPSSSPTPMPGSSPATNGGDHKATSHSHDDDVLTDPQRFTPTLHASLVSEILNVRRELDLKHKFIEDLEVNLKSARDDNDELNEKLAASDKDRRQLKRQLQQLEHGTLAALEEIAKDRDGAKSTCADVKNKLEMTQRKIKSQEEDSERRHAMWEKEKYAWEMEKRGYERRVHITETRLKTVLEELAAHHEATELQVNGVDGEEDDALRDSGVGDDQSETASAQCSPTRRTIHHRSLSMGSPNTFQRFSVQSTSGIDGLKGNGISLADELLLDEEDEDFVEEDEDEGCPEHEVKARRALDSRQSHYQDDKAKRILGLMSGNRMGGLQQPIGLEEQRFQDQNGSIDFRPKTRVSYVDTGVQFSPPPSPQANVVVKDLGKLPKAAQLLYDDQIEANQRKKRVIVSPPPVIDRGQQMSPTPDENPVTTAMVSSSSQTMEDRPISPPATPKIMTPPISPIVAATLPVKIEVASISTQTDPAEEPKSPAGLEDVLQQACTTTPGPIIIPSIAIHPPLSAPSSPTLKEAVLPPGTKNVSCQTMPFSVDMESIGVQTEEIRTDKRLWQKLPPHLLPSFVNSNPPTPDGKQCGSSDKSPMKRSASHSPRSGSPAPDHVPSSPPPMPLPIEIEHRYPGNNDNGPLNGEGSAPRRPFRDSSLFAGFEIDDEEAHLPGEKQSSCQTPFSGGRNMKHVRSFGTRPSPVPEEKATESKPRNQPDQTGSRRGSLDRSRGNGKQKATSIRRSAMIQSGAAAHAHRSRTPSIGSIASSRLSNGSIGPPFPVPDRASSRRLFSHSKSEGSSSPTPKSAGSLFGQRRGPTPRQLVRKDSLRKVRSATAIQRNNSRGRSHNRSPPLNQPVSPSFPPLRKEDVAQPPEVYPSQRSGEKLLAAEMTHVNGKAEGGRASQGTVIDAIAATMVGEWMLKYVRRRKSFGVAGDPEKESIGHPGTDGSVNVTGNGVRHKRWVWLSPYERAVMWSTKQPSSNSALMGKSGRKLIIRSVLDVRDDTPLPKNHGITEPFSRSILILTPTRALKFTAMSIDRHYSWLTALSFLAHSPLLAPGLSSLPPPPDEPTEAELIAQGNRYPSIHRSTIRDSVRVAKDKARPRPNGKSRAPPVPIIQEFHSSPIGTSSTMVMSGGLDSDPIPDAAEAPTVPRFAHGRKRSHTGPRMPSSALRNLQYTQVPMPSYASQASSDYGGGARDFSFIASSGLTSLASTTRSPLASNFPDGGVGTVRMEAFVEDEGGGPRPSQDSSVVLGLGRDSRRNSRWSGSGSDPRRSGMVYSEDFDALDPFRGF